MLSVIVPVYNEEAAIQKTLNDINRSLEGFEYEIIVVNDGSTDNTKERLKECCLKDFLIINHIENLGYGRSLYDGILSAKYNCIAIIDGDGSYPADKIKDLYTYYPQYDMVVGARKGSEYKRGILKRPARAVFRWLAEYATGRSIPDVNSGFRIFKKDVFMKFKDSLCPGFSFTTTITLIFFLNSYYIKYIPIDYFKREGKSKIKHFRDTIRTAQIIVEAILFYNPIKLFLLIASLNSLFGMVLGICNYIFSAIDFLMMISIICVSSFMPIFCLGLVADQLKKIIELKRTETSEK